MSATSEIEQLEDNLVGAMLASDADSLEVLLADDLVFVNQDGRRLGKAEDLAAHRSGLLAIASIDVSGRAVRVLGNAALVWFDAWVAGTYAGEAFAGRFAYTRVWRREGDGWQVVAAHCSAVAS